MIRLFSCIMVMSVMPGYSGRVIPSSTDCTNPSITITQIPPVSAGPDRTETIAGTVSGVDSKDLKIVIYARANTWYVQPYSAAPFTAIDNDGKWETKTHLDNEYSALLVEPSYHPPATTDALPEIAGPVLAVARVAARIEPEPKSSATTAAEKPRTIQFSGFEWKVKSSSGPVGPGPNYFSNSNDNVKVDAQGRLHLRITQRDGRWYCAEVVSVRHLGYGSYRFYLDTDTEKIDPNVVLGMFTWSDDSAYSHREIDIEISRWGRADNQNAQFVIQPYTRPINIVRFQIPPDSKAGLLFLEHTFTRDIPETGDENARINLWLTTGNPPVDAKEIEVIISKFEFVSSR